MAGIYITMSAILPFAFDWFIFVRAIFGHSDFTPSYARRALTLVFRLKKKKSVYLWAFTSRSRDWIGGENGNIFVFCGIFHSFSLDI